VDEIAQNSVTHITLVHGTFAPGAGWTQPGSPLRKEIDNAFPDRVCFHDDFRWSGLPSHLARHVAGKRLHAYLQKLTAEHPGPHYVIGHSHGALVTLYALRDYELARRIEGVVSLSTPYLLVRRRQLSALGWIAAILGGFSAFAILSALTGAPFLRYLNSSQPWYLGPPMLILTLFLSVAAYGLIGGLVLGTGILTMWFLKTMALPEVHSKRLLVVRGPSDEASALISLFHALELLVTAIWGRRGPFDRTLAAQIYKIGARLEGMWERRPRVLISLLGAWLWVGAAILFGALFTATWLETYRPEDFERWANSGSSPFALPGNVLGISFHVVQQFLLTFLPMWLTIALGTLALPALAASAIVVVVMGWLISAGVILGATFVLAVACTALLALTSVPELGPCAATVIVSVEASPPGQYPVVHGTDTEIDAFLTHSWAYTHTVALKAIAAFIAAPKPDSEPLVAPPPPPPPSLREQLREALREAWARL
jgi:hypothetical protein